MIEAQPGWRLELIVTNPEYPPAVDGDPHALDESEIRSRIQVVRQLLGTGQDDAAVLLVWSAVEAALRLVAAREDVDLETDQPDFVTKQLYSLGLLNRKDYDCLRNRLYERDLLAHGYRSPRGHREMVEQLVHHADDLLGESAG